MKAENTNPNEPTPMERAYDRLAEIAGSLATLLVICSPAWPEGSIGARSIATARQFGKICAELKAGAQTKGTP